MLAPPELSEARYANALHQLKLLRSPELQSMFDNVETGSEEGIVGPLARHWSMWLDAYALEYGDQVGHFGALRNIMAEKEQYVLNLFAPFAVRTYRLFKRIWEHLKI